MIFCEQAGNFLKIIKRAGSNKGEQGGKNGKIVKRACSFIRYLRVVRKKTYSQEFLEGY